MDRRLLRLVCGCLVGVSSDERGADIEEARRKRQARTVMGAGGTGEGWAPPEEGRQAGWKEFHGRVSSCRSPREGTGVVAGAGEWFCVGGWLKSQRRRPGMGNSKYRLVWTHEGRKRERLKSER